MSSPWKQMKVSDVSSEIIAGGTPSTARAEFWNGGIPWLTPKDMSHLRERFVSGTSSTISESGLSNSSAKIIPPNSVLLSTRAPVGYLAINTAPIATNQGIKAIVCNDDCYPLYLFYYLKNHTQDLERRANGSTFTELSKSSLEQFEIRLPDLSTQLRIAGVMCKSARRHQGFSTKCRRDRCSSIVRSSSAPFAFSSARRVLKPAIFSLNSSAVIGTYSIFTSKYCPAESV